MCLRERGGEGVDLCNTLHAFWPDVSLPLPVLQSFYKSPRVEYRPVGVVSANHYFMENMGDV